MKQFVILYIKQHKRLLIALLLIFATFAVSFYLYSLPMEAVTYPILFSTLLGGVFTVIDFLRARNKFRQLSEISKLSSSMITSLPAIENVEDKGYQAIIEAIQRENESLENASAEQYTDMVDYYTLWVHQIKIPITAMSLSLQNEDTPLSNKLSSDLFQIKQYVDMVLAYLRLNSNSTDYVFKEYDLDTIIRQAIAKFSDEFIDRKIHLIYEPIKTVVITDEKWLAFVIEQILSNALKYTRHGSIKIYLTDKSLLHIEDTGIGISPEDLPRIFERGYTGYNGREDRSASGIGLYLCKRVCDNLRADISITSELGKGTAVHINLEQYDLNVERLFTKM